MYINFALGNFRYSVKILRIYDNFKVILSVYNINISFFNKRFITNLFSLFLCSSVPFAE